MRACKSRDRLHRIGADFQGLAIAHRREERCSHFKRESPFFMFLTVTGPMRTGGR
jgi:hypothetical protein